jgi:hypothetical protein
MLREQITKHIMMFSHSCTVILLTVHGAKLFISLQHFTRLHEQRYSAKKIIILHKGSLKCCTMYINTCVLAKSMIDIQRKDSSWRGGLTALSCKQIGSTNSAMKCLYLILALLFYMATCPLIMLNICIPSLRIS